MFRSLGVFGALAAKSPARRFLDGNHRLVPGKASADAKRAARYHSRMGLGRRAVRVSDASAWVFNRMADAYAARPAYPAALIDALIALAPTRDARIGELGAGIGHVALPLAAHGFAVTAVEPAQVMLDRLRQTAADRGIQLRTLHAAAESLPLPAASFELVIVADALHFVDAELTAREVARVLAPRGALAVVSCEFADTPFMRSVTRVMEEAAPRRPRQTEQASAQLAALLNVTRQREQEFHDATPVDAETLERILRSISFIGPAMNPERAAAFHARIRALPGPRLWARKFGLRSGSRRG